MDWVYAIVIGVAIGSTMGWTAEHVRVASLVQSVAAFLIALVLGDASTLVWWPRGSGPGQVGHLYLGIGIDNLFYLGLLCILAAALHVGLGRVPAALFPTLMSHRAIILGAAGGLYGTLSGAWAMNMLISWNLR